MWVKQKHGRAENKQGNALRMMLRYLASLELAYITSILLYIYIQYSKLE